jgi:hypothetical protein
VKAMALIKVPDLCQGLFGLHHILFSVNNIVNAASFNGIFYSAIFIQAKRYSKIDMIPIEYSRGQDLSLRMKCQDPLFLTAAPVIKLLTNKFAKQFLTGFKVSENLKLAGFDIAFLILVHRMTKFA